MLGPPYRFLAQREDLADLPVGKLREPALACAHYLFSELLLACDHLVNLLLEGAGADELVDLDVPPLADAKRAVGSLVLDCRVPPPIKVKDAVCPGEVQSRSPGLQGEDEDGRAVLPLEPLDQSLALVLRHSAMKKEDLSAEALLKIPLENLPHLGKLGEDQGSIPDLHDLIQHLRQTGELPGSPRNSRVVTEKVGRMVADL